MQAIVFREYGPPDVLSREEVPDPVRGDKEILVRVRAAAVDAGVRHLIRGEPWPVRLMAGLIKPRINIPGSDLAGVIETVGPGVSGLRPGDKVFGDLSASGFGAFAELACATEAVWAKKPAGLTFEEAAASPGSAVAALQGLRDHARIQSGEHALVIGASGGVGHFAVQIAKAFGAEVTGVCSTDKVDFVRSLGADRVIDYRKEDFTRGGAQFDVILDAGAYRSLFAIRRALRPGGRYVLVGGAFGRFLQALLVGPALSVFGSRKMGNMMATPNRDDLNTIRELLESGKIRPAIDRRFELAEAAEGIRYLEEGRVRGKVVIEVGEGEGG